MYRMCLLPRHVSMCECACFILDLCLCGGRLDYSSIGYTSSLSLKRPEAIETTSKRTVFRPFVGTSCEQFCFGGMFFGAQGRTGWSRPSRPQSRWVP
eukprot:scaffold132545_cov47-Attheya_sp.AAC.3